MVTDQRTVFAAEVASIAKRHKGSVRAEAVTTSGYTVLFTGMWGDRIDAITITTPDGQKVRRADGWRLSETAEVAAFLWDVLDEDRARAAERERLAGLKSVTITSMNAIGWASGKDTGRYHLTPEQLVQLLTLAEQLDAENTAAPAEG
ncbi:hypothetical protein ACWECC_33185 [Streptomyces microflavus]